MPLPQINCYISDWHAAPRTTGSRRSPLLRPRSSVTLWGPHGARSAHGCSGDDPAQAMGVHVRAAGAVERLSSSFLSAWLTAVTRQKSPICPAVKRPLHRTGCPSRRPGAWTLASKIGSASSLEVKSEPKIPLNPVPVTVPWSGHRENRSIHESTCLQPQLARRRRPSHD